MKASKRAWDMVASLQARVRHIKAATDLVTLISGQLVSKIFGFAAFATLARLLTPAEYGAVETVVGMVAIGHMIIEFGSGILGIRRVAHDRAQVAEITAAVTSSRILVALIVAPLLVTAYAAMVGDRTPIGLIVLFGFSLFGAVFKLDWLFQGHDEMGPAALGITLKMLVFFGLILVWAPLSHNIMLVGWTEILSMALMGAYYVYTQRKRYGFKLDLTQWRSGVTFLRLSAPLGLSSFANTVSQSLPVLFVQSLSSGEQAGEFGAAQRVITSLITFSWLYYQNLFPLLSRQIAQKPKEAQELVHSSDHFIAWAGAAAGVGLALGAQPLMRLGFGPALAQSALEFSILAWCLPVTLASGSARWLLIAQDRHKTQMVIQFIGAFVTLAATFLLAPHMGGVGAAIGMLVGAFVIWVCATITVQGCAVRPSLFALAGPALSSAAVMVLARFIPLPPLVVAILGGSGVIIFGLAIPRVREACLFLIKSKRTPVDVVTSPSVKDAS